MKKTIIQFCVLFLFCLQLSFSQTKTITGTVTSATDNSPLPGVSVVLKGTTNGCATNFEGKFNLVIPNESETLVFSFIGMITQEVPISGRTVINVKMQDEALEVDEVMVVAYGTSKKESFTGSAEVVKAEKLTKRVSANITKALEGQAAGIQTTSGSGQPGSGAEIRIRGFGSLNSSNSPLYVVDGVPYDGNLNAINSNDVESIVLLKDASAGALYGSRGANGVVMITTKKGKEGKTSVELKFSQGFSNRGLKKYETLNSKEYIETVYQGYKNQLIYQEEIDPANAGQAAINELIGANGVFGYQEEYNFYNLPVAELIDIKTGKIKNNATCYHESDWLKEITNDNAQRKEYQILINSGTEKTKVFTSFAYLDEEGLLKNTSFERFSGRIGAEIEAKKWFKYGGNVNFAQTTSNYLSKTGSSTANVWNSAQFMAPIYPVYQRNRKGELILSKLGEKQFDYGTHRPGGAQTNWNSVATLYEDKTELKFDNLSGRFHVDLLGGGIHQVIEGLSITSNFGFDFVNSNEFKYDNPLFGDAADAHGRLNKKNIRKLGYTWNQLLRYEKTIQQHKFNILVGHEFYEYKNNEFEGEKTGFPYAGIYELAAGSTLVKLTSFENNYSIESFLSNFNYDFKDRYYLSASFRRDASSRFHKDHRWGNFWSVGGSWRISEESFLNDVSFVNNLTLKASYGVQGNDNINDYYAWQSLYDLSWPNSSIGGAVLSSLGNEKIKWEENVNFNIGIESRFFDRVHFACEYYNRKTVDMLMKRPMPLSTGFANYWDNVGEMLNEGIELTTNVDIFKSHDFTWTANFNVATIHNEILKLDGEKDEIISGWRIQKVGHEINSFYLPESAGVDPQTGAKLYKIMVKNDKGQMVEDVTDDKATAINNSKIVGSRIPDFYGAFGSEFTFLKNFDASFMTSFSKGGYIYDYVYNDLMNPIYVGANYHKDVLKAWKKPGDITDIPRVENGTGFSRTATDNELVDASYFAIKNITLGYTLPKHLTDRIGLNNVRLYATLDNVAIFTKLDGINPQHNFSGSTDYVYTPIRTTLFGIDINF